MGEVFKLRKASMVFEARPQPRNDERIFISGLHNAKYPCTDPSAGIQRIVIQLAIGYVPHSICSNNAYSTLFLVFITQ